MPQVLEQRLSFLLYCPAQDPRGDIAPDVATGERDGRERRANYWLARKGFKGPAFTYEFPALVRVMEVELRNTNDAGNTRYTYMRAFPRKNLCF